MEVKIESGPVEVIASGTVIAYNHQPIEISVGPSTDRLNIVIVFMTGEPPKKLPFPLPSDRTALPPGIRIPGQFPLPGMRELSKVKYEVLDSHTLRITFRNINAPTGYGTLKPVQIGTIEGKPVHLHYRIYDLGETSDKMLHYTLYREKK